MHTNSSVSFKKILQRLTAQFTMEAELLTAALTKESGFFSEVTKELGFGKLLDSVLVYIDNTLALHVTGNLTFNMRIK